MKKYFYLSVLVGFMATQGSAFSSATHKPTLPKGTLEEQVAKYVWYPNILKFTQQDIVAVIQFQINEANELCQLKVFSKNDQLNQLLQRQLTGKKLMGYGTTADELYTVRLHFQP